MKREPVAYLCFKPFYVHIYRIKHSFTCFKIIVLKLSSDKTYRTQLPGKCGHGKSRPNYMKNSFNYSGAALWSSLPIEVRRAHTPQFKTHCGNFFDNFKFFNYIYVYHGTHENQV